LKKIQIEGPAEDIANAVGAVIGILFELEKEAHNKLEAESLSKEVIMRLLFLLI